MQKEKILQNDRYNMFLVFLVAFLPRLIMILCFATPFSVPMDEMSTISTAAIFGGADWTALTSKAKFYYGGGFTILFAPLFYFDVPAKIIYQIMLIVFAAMQSVCGLIGYYIMRKGFHIKNKVYVFVAALVCSYLMVTRSMVAFNEHPLILLCWIFALVLLKLYENLDNSNGKILYTILMFLLMGYSLTIHTRFKVVWPAFIIVVIVYAVMYKKCLVNIPAAVISGVVSWLGADKFKTFIMKKVWLWEEGEFLRNVTVNVDVSLGDIFSAPGWKGIGSIIIGQINTALIISGGFLVIVTILFLYLMKENLEKTFLRKQKRNHTPLYQPAEMDMKLYLIIGLFFVLCIGATIAAQSITWLDQVLEAFQHAPYTGSEYEFKAYTYLRYMGPFLGPFMLTGIVAVYYLREKIQKLIPHFCFVTIILQGIWLLYIVPDIIANNYALNVLIPFTFLFETSYTARLGYYVLASVVTIAFYIAFMILLYKKKIVKVLGLLLVLLVYQYCYNGIYIEAGYMGKRALKVDTGTELILKMDEIYDMPDEIYVEETIKSVQKGVYIYQFLFGKAHKVYLYAPKETTEDTIVFCNKEEYEPLTEQGYRWCKLDENEYLYVWGETYRKYFEKEGYTFN